MDAAGMDAAGLAAAGAVAAVAAEAGAAPTRTHAVRATRATTTATALLPTGTPYGRLREVAERRALDGRDLDAPRDRQNGPVSTRAAASSRGTGGSSPRRSSPWRPPGGAALPRVLADGPVAGRRRGLPRGRRVDPHRSADLLRLTGGRKLLPFTYPPFAARTLDPLAFMPLPAAGWLWTALQVLATTAIVWYAGYRLIHRADGWMPLASPPSAPMLWLHPVSDGIRFGQVNAFIVLALYGPALTPPGVLRHVPRGVLRRAAMAVKLTPGVFVVPSW